MSSQKLSLEVCVYEMLLSSMLALSSVYIDGWSR